MTRLHDHYNNTVKPALIKEFGYTNPMQAPRLDKIVLNMGVGEGVTDRKKVEAAAKELALIAGQKAVITKAKKSIATYKLRDADPDLGRRHRRKRGGHSYFQFGAYRPQGR